jgi:aldose 1-epimerase
VTDRSAIPPSGEQVELAFADQRAVVVEVGGGLRTYSAGGHDVIDGYTVDEMCSGGRGQVLSPWPNRLEDGSYEFEGRRHQLALTEPVAGNAIHGLVRWAAWRVSECEAHRVLMEHVLHPGPGYPFSVALGVEYVLSEDGLRVRTTAVNVGRDACPYGSGTHPYLTVGTETVDSVVLRVPARTVLASKERGLPVDSRSVGGTDYDFRRPRQIGSTRLDNCFTDLERDDDGVARVELRGPDRRPAVTLWVDSSYPYLMLYTGDTLPPEARRRGLAVEPMTCPPNAFRTGEAVIRLEPGDTTTSAWGIVPSAGP